MVPEDHVRCYQVCHMVPEARVKTCCYQVCHMVPETHVKTCCYKVCHMVEECKTVEIPYKCCHMVQETCVEASPLHGLQAGSLLQDDPSRALRTDAGSVHSDPLRAEGCVRGGAGAGLLPSSLRADLRGIVRLHEIDIRGFGRSSDLCPVWRGTGLVR